MTQTNLSPADAIALLKKLEAEHGPFVLASLMGAGFAMDMERGAVGEMETEGLSQKEIDDSIFEAWDAWCSDWSACQEAIQAANLDK